MAGMQKTKGGDRGGEEVDGESEADPRVWQARLTLSIFISNGKSFKKRICCFILSLQNNCRGCNYGEPFERSKQC